MDTVPLSAQARSDQKANILRTDGKVPCVLYGHDTENISLQCEEGALRKAYIQAGESTLVELDTGDKKTPVLFYEVKFDAISGKITHADFYAVNMKEEIETTVPIVLDGEAPAVKDLDGILVTPRDHVTVKCLPKDLPSEFRVSLESLTELTSTLTVADLTVSEGVTIAEEADRVIALIQEKRKEEEIVPEVTEGEGEESEEKEGEKKEGEEDEKKDDASADKKE
jgi:large subunit ribosomal protein L25